MEGTAGICRPVDWLKPGGRGWKGPPDTCFGKDTPDTALLLTLVRFIRAKKTLALATWKRVAPFLFGSPMRGDEWKIRFVVKRSGIPLVRRAVKKRNVFKMRFAPE